jgi:hypothetical protein
MPFTDQNIAFEKSSKNIPFPNLLWFDDRHGCQFTNVESLDEHLPRLFNAELAD